MNRGVPTHETSTQEREPSLLPPADRLVLLVETRDREPVVRSDRGAEGARSAPDDNGEVVGGGNADVDCGGVMLTRLVETRDCEAEGEHGKPGVGGSISACTIVHGILGGFWRPARRWTCLSFGRGTWVRTRSVPKAGRGPAEHPRPPRRRV